MESFFKGVVLKKEENKLFYGDTYVDNKEIFVWDDGHSIRPDYVYHHFKKLAEIFGRPDMTFHSLRHSTASILFELGWHPKENTGIPILQRIPVSYSINRSDVIRTRDLYVPNVALYQAEPHSDMYELVFS